VTWVNEEVLVGILEERRRENQILRSELEDLERAVVDALAPTDVGRVYVSRNSFRQMRKKRVTPAALVPIKAETGGDGERGAADDGGEVPAEG
jgi:hypothetical protein